LLLASRSGIIPVQCIILVSHVKSKVGHTRPLLRDRSLVKTVSCSQDDVFPLEGAKGMT
jgi:hypothetical protein